MNDISAVSYISDEDNDFDKVETQYNELYKILSEKNEYELLKIIDRALDDEIAKNKWYSILDENRRK